MCVLSSHGVKTKQYNVCVRQSHNAVMLFFWYLVPFNLIRRTHSAVYARSIVDLFVASCIAKCLLAALFISLFCCYTIVFIIVVHAFILSTIPWNRIGSHNLSFVSFPLHGYAELCFALLICVRCAQCNALFSVSTKQMRAMWNEKGTHITIQWRQTKGNRSFSLADFSSSWCFSFFRSRVALFLFEIDFCAYFFPFHFQCITHCIKGKEWRSRAFNACRIREWIECYRVVERVHCMVERAHFMSEFVVLRLTIFSQPWWNRLVEIRKEMNIRVRRDTFFVSYW